MITDISAAWMQVLPSDNWYISSLDASSTQWQLIYQWLGCKFYPVITDTSVAWMQVLPSDISAAWIKVLFYCILGYVLPLQEVALRQSSIFLCPLLSSSIPLLVAPQCHLSNDVLVFQLILHPHASSTQWYNSGLDVGPNQWYISSLDAGSTQ